MPYVNIKITNEGATKEQKAKLIAGVTRLLAEVLHKNPASTVVVIDEVDMDNWGLSGLPIAEARKKNEKRVNQKHCGNMPQCFFDVLYFVLLIMRRIMPGISHFHARNVPMQIPKRACRIS